MAIITRVDEYFLRSKVPVPYPSVLIDSGNVDALPLLMQSLEEGDVSVIFEYNGEFNVPKKKISRSAYTLAKLLGVYKFTVLLSKDKRIPIRSKSDILEVGEWTP